MTNFWLRQWLPYTIAHAKIFSVQIDQTNRYRLFFQIVGLWLDPFFLIVRRRKYYFWELNLHRSSIVVWVWQWARLILFLEILFNLSRDRTNQWAFYLKQSFLSDSFPLNIESFYPHTTFLSNASLIQSDFSTFHHYYMLSFLLF